MKGRGGEGERGRERRKLNYRVDEKRGEKWKERGREGCGGGRREVGRKMGS